MGNGNSLWCRYKKCSHSLFELFFCAQSDSEHFGEFSVAIWGSFIHVWVRCHDSFHSNVFSTYFASLNNQTEYAENIVFRELLVTCSTRRSRFHSKRNFLYAWIIKRSNIKFIAIFLRAANERKYTKKSWWEMKKNCESVRWSKGISNVWLHLLVWVCCERE